MTPVSRQLLAFVVLLTMAILLSLVMTITTKLIVPIDHHSHCTASGGYRRLRGSYPMPALDLKGRRHSGFQPNVGNMLEATVTRCLFKYRTQGRSTAIRDTQLEGNIQGAEDAPITSAAPRDDLWANYDVTRVGQQYVQLPLQPQQRQEQQRKDQQQKQKQQKRRTLLSVSSRSDSSLCPPGLPLCQAAAMRQREARERSRPAPDQKEVIA